MEFNETQKFNQPLLWVILLGLSTLFLVKLVNNTSELNWISFLVIIAVCLLFITMHLKTNISKRGVKYSFFPFISKTIAWEDIENVEVINYGFIGGWGIRFTIKYGIVYNVKGNKGLFIRLKSGKKIVIGTQKSEEIKRAANFYQSS